MYCGSCLRDNALATELLARGHDVTLLPLYTPTLTDEPNVSHEKVFFGGISVYLQQRAAAIRKTPWLLDSLWDSKLALNAASRRSIPTDPRLLGDLTVSMLKGEDGFQRKEIEKLLHWLRQDVPPDVIDLPNCLLIGLAGPLSRTLQRPVSCTLQGEDLFLAKVPEPFRAEALRLIRAQTQHVSAFIAVSDWYATFMVDYLQIRPEKMHVVPLGIKLDDFAPVERSRTDGFTIGYLARVAPEKGLHLLADAYCYLRRQYGLPEARLEAAGYLGPEHRPYLQRIHQRMEAEGLEREFHYRGALDRQQKMQFLRSLDVFSMPATYDEPKGLPVLEAMASGVPVVLPRRGAFSEMVERTSGGLLVEPDNPHALAEGILSLWRDRSHAEKLGQRAATGVRAHYSIGRTADRALDVYRRLLECHSSDLSGQADRGSRVAGAS